VKIALMTAYIIIGLNVLVSLAGFKALQNMQTASRFLFIPYLVKQGQNMNGLLLSHFSHANLFHLFINMFSFWSFSGSILTEGGALFLIFVYVAAGMGGDLFVYFLRKENPDYRCLGASGSVVGIIFAAIVYNPDIIVSFFIVPIPGPIFALGFLLISLFLTTRPSSGISHEAHAGGALAGLIAAAITARHGLQPLLDYFLKFIS
jgi:membrane associated rhomboid family serine protease